MKRAIQFLFLFVAVPVATVGKAEASLLTFTNRTAFENAAGSLDTYDFNSAPTGFFTTRSFGDFQAINTNPFLLRTLVRPAGGFPSSIDGSNHLAFYNLAPTQSTLSVNFQSGISAFGFDWRTTDVSRFADGLDFVVNGMSFNLGSGFPQRGFFGVIDTMGGTFNQVGFRDDVGRGNGINDFVGLDNFTYGSAASPIPEPASIICWTLMAGVGGLGMARKRRKHNQP